MPLDDALVLSPRCATKPSLRTGLGIPGLVPCLTERRRTCVVCTTTADVDTFSERVSHRLHHGTVRSRRFDWFGAARPSSSWLAARTPTLQVAPYVTPRRFLRGSLAALFPAQSAADDRTYPRTDPRRHICRFRTVRCREPPLVRGCVKAALYAAANDNLPALKSSLEEVGDVNATDWGRCGVGVQQSAATCFPGQSD